MATWPPLPDSQVLHRAYRNESDRDIKAGKPKPKVFYRRQAESGLSVGLTIDRILRTIVAAGRCELLTGGVRLCVPPLDVIQDEIDHANILGVPLREENEEAALAIARYLARISEDKPLP
jgi:hypothetical protein